MATRSIVYTALIAATYIVITFALTPLSFGPLQLRAANLLYPLALFNPIFALAFAIGVAISNLHSPFGFWDIALMPLVTAIAALTCYYSRRYPYLALILQSAIIATGVTLFPLHLGGNIPIWPTFAYIFLSTVTIVITAYLLIWKHYHHAIHIR